MTRALDGTVALVTGASSGIGRATALALADAGASVGLLARRGDRLQVLADELSRAGGAVEIVATDIGEEQDVIQAVEQVAARFGRIDTLVNNAGVMLLDTVEEAGSADWDRMVSVNLLGLMRVTKVALPHLLAAAATSERRVADVVNVSSVAGRRSRATSSVYAATKAGVIAFSEALRQEVTGRHVRVLAIEPGAVETELLEQNHSVMHQSLLERYGGIERLRDRDIAEIVMFAVTRPRHVTLNEILVRPTEQEG